MNAKYSLSTLVKCFVSRFLRLEIKLLSHFSFYLTVSEEGFKTVP